MLLCRIVPSLGMTVPLLLRSKLVGLLIFTAGVVIARQAAQLPDRQSNKRRKRTNSQPEPLSVNFHFIRSCNYHCKFCFHTALSSFVLPLDEAMRGLQMLKDAGMQKVNFSGGEPFLQLKGRYVGQLVKFSKERLGLDSVTLVTNGSLVTREWFQSFGKYLDIMAVSCDSFDHSTLNKIGRHQKNQGDHLAKLHDIAEWCREFNVKFKINTVVTSVNYQEDMRQTIRKLKPARWKVFQCLLIAGENTGETALRNAESMVVSDQQFKEFCQVHEELGCFVPESNDLMRNSYLILDEQMRFLDNRNGSKVPSESILKVGLEPALRASGFDEAAFYERGGKFDWSKSQDQNPLDPDRMDW